MVAHCQSLELICHCQNYIIKTTVQNFGKRCQNIYNSEIYGTKLAISARFVFGTFCEIVVQYCRVPGDLALGYIEGYQGPL